MIITEPPTTTVKLLMATCDPLVIFIIIPDIEYDGIFCICMIKELLFFFSF